MIHAAAPAAHCYDATCALGEASSRNREHLAHDAAKLPACDAATDPLWNGLAWALVSGSLNVA